MYQDATSPTVGPLREQSGNLHAQYCTPTYPRSKLYTVESIIRAYLPGDELGSESLRGFVASCLPRGLMNRTLKT